MSEDTFDTLRLLVNELVTNSVRHSGARGSPIDLMVWVSGALARAEVHDAGRGFRPQPQDPGLWGSSGRGLFLVEELADRWGSELESGTTVWFELEERAL